MRWPLLIFAILVTCAGCEQSCSCVQSHPPADEPVSEAAAAEIADAAVRPNLSPSVFRDFKRHRSHPFDKDLGSKPELLVPDAAAK